MFGLVSKVILKKALDYLRSVSGHFKIQKWRVWSTGSAIYVRLTIEISYDEASVYKIVVLKFTKDSVLLVPDYDPRNERLSGDE